MNKLIDERVREIAERVAVENGFEIVNVQLVGTVNNLTVRIYIDKPHGVTHEDCTLTSRGIEAILDADDFLTSNYVLEVSSPGLERELYSEKDFLKFAGNLAKIKTIIAIDGQKNFRGRIVGVENGEVIFEDKIKGEIRFPYSNVAKANLEIDLEEELRERKADRSKLTEI